jgi:hypothetical protein
VTLTALFTRCDFASGSHRITPTAVDKDFWGNYKVYYKTADFTKNSEEDYYYIEKKDKELAAQMRECIEKGQTVIVYYGTYVGMKGLSSPQTSPINRIEVIE